MTALAEILTWVGVGIVAYNAYYGWLDPWIARIAKRTRRFVSGVPLAGSLALLAGSLLGGPLGLWPALVGMAVDPAGPLWLVVSIARDWRGRKEDRA